MINLEAIVRKNIRDLAPYRSARSEFEGQAQIYLDANENPVNTHLNRYPDPLQQELKRIISERKSVSTERIFVGNGSDEAIDLLYRAFCEPGVHQAIVFSPTYGM